MRCLADIPHLQAHLRPDGTAQIFEGRRTTFAEFDQRTNQVAHALLELDFEPQSRVGYLGKNSDQIKFPKKCMARQTCGGEY